jgi:hypothetical protein
MGTLDYVAPEQLRNAAAVDIRADVYSLGCTLYHLLAGEPPFAASGRDLADKIVAQLQQAPPPIRARRPDVPAELAAALDRLLAKDPAARYDTPAEVAAALERFTTGSDLQRLPGARSAVRPRAVRPPARLLTRRRLLATGAAAVLLSGGVWLWQKSAKRSSGGPPLEVRHFREREGRMAEVGVLGVDTTALRLGSDAVRVAVRLREPAFVYLIAFNPDGTEQLCVPEQKDERPRRTAELVFPEDGYFEPKPEEGVGLLAFVAVALRESLPYAEWRGRLGTLSWRRTAAAGVWGYDGRKFEHRPSDRGQVRPLGVPPEYQELCRSVQERGGVEEIHALAFPVVNRESGR